MVTHPRISHGIVVALSLNFSDLTFTLIALIVGSCLYCTELRHLTWDLIIPCEKTMFTAHSSLKWQTLTQYKHDQNVKAVRVNGQITEVKQPIPWLVLRWVTI